MAPSRPSQVGRAGGERGRERGGESRARSGQVMRLTRCRPPRREGDQVHVARQPAPAGRVLAHERRRLPRHPPPHPPAVKSSPHPHPPAEDRHLPRHALARLRHDPLPHQRDPRRGAVHSQLLMSHFLTSEIADEVFTPGVFTPRRRTSPSRPPPSRPHQGVPCSMRAPGLHTPTSLDTTTTTGVHSRTLL